MNIIKMLAVMLIIIVGAGCQLQTESIEEVSSYVNNEYNYQIIYPKEWIGKVKYVEDQADRSISFYYTEIPDDKARIISFGVMTPEEWEEDVAKWGCCGSSEITRTDQHVYIEYSVLDMPIMCELDDGEIENCEEKVTELLEINRSYDVNQHFQLID